jgi:hypothetical protein
MGRNFFGDKPQKSRGILYKISGFCLPTGKSAARAELLDGWAGQL